MGGFPHNATSAEICGSVQSLVNSMIDIEQTLQGIQRTLCPKIEIAALYARSEIAHKWKLTFRLISLREALSWRLIDILQQAYKTGRMGMIVVVKGSSLRLIKGSSLRLTHILRCCKEGLCLDR